ncbi:MAG TPA: molybdenum ABC transporter ATP-binding protein [Terriglobia bacterium]|nr:molybdenum ABC transporter ATP-binding protein [Terriglobia bacterium]
MIDIHATQRLGELELNIELRIENAGVLALFGPSGAGKTSILNWIAGLSRPDGGRIAIDGRVLFDSEAGINLPPEQRGLSYVFQEPRLFPHLGVKANLLYGWHRRHRHDGDTRQPGRPEITLDQVVRLLGIEHLLGRRIAGLSGGEQQRVAIGRALLAQPQLLLMDEPLAAVDARRKSEILPFIESLHAELRIPIIYISHDPDEVLRIADQVALIVGGRLVTVGDMETVLGRLDLPALSDAAEPGAVITATVVEVDDGTGLSVLALSDQEGVADDTAVHGVPQTIRIGRLPLQVGDPVHLRLLARDVALAREVVDGISILNQLPGVVRQILPGAGHFVDFQLDIGPLIWARITRKSAQQMKLQVGDPAVALIKSLAADPKKFS